MKILVKKISFNRWKAEFFIDDVLCGRGVGNRPGCAVKDAINEVCLKYGEMPEELVVLNIQEWN